MPDSAAETMSLRSLLDQDLGFITGQLRDELATLAGRRVLITGGAGFLGYYLVLALDHWNRRAVASDRVGIVVLDNFARGEPRWIVKLAGGDRVTVLRHDVREPLPPTLAPYHYVVHAAGIASPTYYRKHPIETMDANVIGLRALLEFARGRLAGPDPMLGLLFLSSSEIYGDPPAEWIPTPEHYRGYVSCTGPRACYDESKRYGETLCVNFARAHGVPVAVARPFNNYGPGLKISDGRVIPDFARDILGGRDIVLLSDGTPSRTFCYVADAVAGYLRVLLRGRPGEAYNIGIEAPEITMAALANRMAELGRAHLGYRGRVVRQQSRETEYLVDNPVRRCPSIRKAREELGYAPVIPLDEGLGRTLVWYSHHPDGADA